MGFHCCSNGVGGGEGGEEPKICQLQLPNKGMKEYQVPFTP